MRSNFSLCLALIVCCLACCSVSCGSSKKPPASDAGMPKSRCIAPGIGGTCQCASGQNGTNTCGSDGYWGACQCVVLPPGARCREGEQLRCGSVCPGESTARTTRCVNGDYDCSCPTAGSAVESGAGGQR
jgi:hypothetical protein